LESALTHIAPYAASTIPWIEIIWGNVPHYVIRQNVSDTGRLGQK